MKSDVRMKEENIVLVAIYDKVSKLFTPPFAFSSKVVAMREYMRLIKPLDDVNYYALYYIGEYNNSTGCIKSIEPLKVCDGDQCLNDDFKFVF